MVLRLNYYTFWLRMVCYFIPLVAFAVATYVRFFTKLSDTLPVGYDPDFYFAVLMFTTLIWAIAAEHYDVCSVEELFRENTGLRSALSASVATYVVLVCTLFFYREETCSRLFLALSAGAMVIVTFVVRTTFRRIMKVRMGGTPTRVLMVGADEFARRSVHRLQRVPFADCRVIAHIRLPEQKVAVKGVPVCDLDDLQQANNWAFDDVVIALPMAQFSKVPGLMRSLGRFCVPIRAIVDMGDGLTIRERLFQFGRLQMLNLDSTPAERMDYSILKRTFDVAFSALAILITSPVLLAIAAAVKLSSPGPVFFRQQRVGLNGQIFSMLKFRTMKVSTSTEADTRWTTADDPRRTRIGAFLRKSSLDELPQFFNVLKGDMSVVGPRPERPFFVRKFLQEMAQYNSRHRLKVGITGWAQVNGWRGDTSIHKRIEYDLYYLQNWSFAFDCRIVIMTFFSGLLNRNAY